MGTQVNDGANAHSFDPKFEDLFCFLFRNISTCDCRTSKNQAPLQSTSENYTNEFVDSAVPIETAEFSQKMVLAGGGGLVFTYSLEAPARSLKLNKMGFPLNFISACFLSQTHSESPGCGFAAIVFIFINLQIFLSQIVVTNFFEQSNLYQQ